VQLGPEVAPFPKTPCTRLSTFVPGATSARVAASSPRIASPCINSTSFSVRKTCFVFSAVARNRAMKTGS
jgi:hypothetical protein